MRVKCKMFCFPVSSASCVQRDVGRTWNDIAARRSFRFFTCAKTYDGTSGRESVEKCPHDIQKVQHEEGDSELVVHAPLVEHEDKEEDAGRLLSPHHRQQQQQQ